MRDNDGTYQFFNLSLRALSEVDLLAHYSLAAIPDRTAVHQLRVVSLAVDQAAFSMGGLLASDEQIVLRQTADKLTVCCSCAFGQPSLCYHEMLTMVALITQPSYHAFFDEDTRRNIFLPYATRYGLDDEERLDHYFSLVYDKGNLLVELKQENILPVDTAAPDKELLPVLFPERRRPDLAPLHKERILVISRHRFYNQLRFELLDVDSTRAGKPKAPFVFIDPATLLWKTKNLDEAKLYAALASFQQQYSEEEEDTTLEALHVICAQRSHLSTYYHDRSVSENINSKSLRPAKLAVLEASIELSVFQREPFYEIRAYLLWDDKRISLKTLQLQQRYFLKRQDDFLLVPDMPTLRLLEYFKKSPEILLVHQSKYADFFSSTLQPLADIIRINYAYIRPATAAETKVFKTNTERIIYFSQENSYIDITPVIRYGEVEIPLSSRKTIISRDENGNTFEVERSETMEDQFKQLVVKQHPDFESQLQERNYFYLHHQSFLDGEWFLEAFEAWRNEGITLLGFQEMNLTKLSPYKAKIDVKVLSGTDWFNVKIVASYGEQQVSIRQLHRAIRHKKNYIQLDDGRIGILPNEWIDKIAPYFQFAVLEADLLKIPKIAVGTADELFKDEVLTAELSEEIDALRKRVSNIKKRETISVPTALQTTLRPYQLDGLHWLNQLDELQYGGCLADDMGLGKTVQMIAYLLLQQEKGQQGLSLIIAPTSLIFNWQQELEKFAPSLRVLSLQGTSRQALFDHMTAYDVVLTSYGLLLSDIAQLKKYVYNALILDESQAIKNPRAERYKAARLLHARTRFALTGTPIENNTYDLYGQLSFACPGLLGSEQFFKDTYATPIDRFQDSKRATLLQEKIAPFILRRTKKQVAKELPEKTEMLIYCEMGTQQREIYDHYEAELRDYLQGKTDDELDRNNIHVLAGLTRLRQICNAPFLLKEGYPAQLSAKLDVLVERVQELQQEHKILVFSQFVEMLDLVKDALNKQGISTAYLSGKTKDRAKVVSAFQTDPAQRVFLISLKAGGVGLNLTAADYVFLVDPWWNPAVENQAIDRSYRIGQDKQVVAVRLICPDTVEDKIIRLQDKKRELAGEMIKTDSDIASKFTKKDWLHLLQ